MGLRIVRETADAVDLLSWLGERRPVTAIDTETTGTDVRAPGFKVRLFQIGDTQTAWVVPFEQWQGLVAEIVRKVDGRLAVHNAQFDLPALATHGIHIP